MMLRRAALSISSLALAGVLLLNFQGPAAIATAVIDKTSGSSGSKVASVGTSTGIAGSTSGSTSGSTGSTSGSGSGTSAGTSTATGTYKGDLLSMPYGNVQVQITVANGVITDVQALVLPTGGHSGRISGFVAPILRSEALAAQSASIDVVSGATYTSLAYAQSLQSALDAAGLRA